MRRPLSGSVPKDSDMQKAAAPRRLPFCWLWDRATALSGWGGGIGWGGRGDGQDLLLSLARVSVPGIDGQDCARHQIAFHQLPADEGLHMPLDIPPEGTGTVNWVVSDRRQRQMCIRDRSMIRAISALVSGL